MQIAKGHKAHQLLLFKVILKVVHTSCLSFLLKHTFSNVTDIKSSANYFALLSMVFSSIYALSINNLCPVGR